MAHKLTKRIVDAAQYEGEGGNHKACYIWDAQQKGFGLRVYPSGRKVFVLRYRNADGRRRLIQLGEYGPITVQLARKIAIEKRAAVEMGGDPLAEREEKTKRGTVSKLADDYLELHAKPHKKTWKTDESRIKNYILPELGQCKACDVNRADVDKLHKRIGKGALANRSGGRYEANRVIALLRIMFEKAEQWGHVPSGHRNPVVGIEKFKEQARERFVSPEEMPALARSINAELDPYVRAALWLYLFTGCRKNELLQARWKDIDLEQSILELPETKAGRSHRVPLSAPALKVLRQLPRKLHNPYVFPGKIEGAHRVNIDKPWRRVRKRAGLEGLQIHDLRRTLGSWMALGGESLPIIGKALNHTTPNATAVYARLTNDPVRRAMSLVGEQLSKAAGTSGSHEQA